MQTGIYEVISPVDIRREPRIVEYQDPKTKKFVTNKVGLLTPGTQRMIYSVLTDEHGASWGRVSAADSAGIAEWACIQNINRVFLKYIPNDAPPGNLELRVIELERKLDIDETLLAKIAVKLGL